MAGHDTAATTNPEKPIGTDGQHPNTPAALSIDVEDWFHTENLRGVCPVDSWNSFELRVERNTMRMLEILADRDVTATFFVLGWVAERCPSLIRAIATAGHEVASHGYGHELVYTLSPEAFRADLVRSKAMLEDIAQVPVKGYRAPSFSITEWAIPILQEVGFTYDSSMVATVMHDRYGRIGGIDARTPIVRLIDDFHEVCVSCVPAGARGIPWGGGGYFRIVPFAIWLRGIKAIQRVGLPYVFYIHPWEIDPGQPKPRGLKLSYQFRQRINLSRGESRFAALVGALNWTTVDGLLSHWKTSPEARGRHSSCPKLKDIENSFAARHPARRAYQ